MDPYFIIKCGVHEFTSSAKIQAGLTPSWENEILTVPTDGIDIEKTMVKIQFWDWDWFKYDDLIGETKEIPIEFFKT